MNYLESEISALYASAHELCYLGMDGRPIYSDQFTRLNRDVFSQANALYDKHGDSDEEEARLCLSLLMGYNATLYNNGDKEERIQHILDRCWDVLTSACLSVESPTAGLLLRRSFRRGIGPGSSGHHRYMAGQRVVGRRA